MSESFHYPPELLNLLVDIIPLLCRSKTDVILFFQGAGVPAEDLADLRTRVTTDRKGISKYEIARTVLQRINERGDSYLRHRREVLKRVVEFEDFSSCWPEDQLKAKGLLSDIRRVVNVKDAFVRMTQERDSERTERMEAARLARQEVQRKRENLARVKSDLYALFGLKDNPQERGKQLEKVLNDLFRAYGILVKEDFKRRSPDSADVIEQVDGIIQLDGHFYLVEMKWISGPVGVNHISRHFSRLFLRSDTRGLFIAAEGYAATTIAECRDALSKIVLALCSLQEFVALLEREGNLEEMLRAKVRAAELDKSPFHEILG